MNTEITNLQTDAVASQDYINEQTNKAILAEYLQRAFKISELKYNISDDDVRNYVLLKLRILDKIFGSKKCCNKTVRVVVAQVEELESILNL